MKCCNFMCFHIRSCKQYRNDRLDTLIRNCSIRKAFNRLDKARKENLKGRECGKGHKFMTAFEIQWQKEKNK